MFMISALFSVFGFFANIIIIVVIYVLITQFLAGFIYDRFRDFCRMYSRLRTFYYKVRCSISPGDVILADKCRRSMLRTEILFMKSQLIFLTDKYGSFDICPKCKFPHPPGAYSCTFCNYTPQENLDASVRLINGNNYVHKT